MTLRFIGLVLFAIVFGGAAHAQMPRFYPDEDGSSWREIGSRFFAGRPVGESRFDSLAARYNSRHASTPSNEELRGWRSGRCYFAERTNTAENGLLAGLISETRDDEGPLFGPEEQHRIMVIRYPDQPAPFFDDMDRTVRTQIHGFIGRYRDSITPIESLNDGSVASVNNLVDTEYRAKWIDNVIVVKSVATRTVRRTRRTPARTEGDVISYCYFYRQVD